MIFPGRHFSFFLALVTCNIMTTAAFSTQHYHLITSHAGGRAFGVNNKPSPSLFEKSTASTAEDVLEPVKTPKTDIPHNFGPCTIKRDDILFTCQRPGTDPKEKGKGVVPKEDVNKWLTFMKGNGITDVLVLLDENELEVYPDPGLLELYKAGGINPHLTPLSPDGAYNQIMDILREVEQRNGKAVTHCTGGTGRAGRVAAAWLATRYELTPSEATQETVDAAIDSGVQRLGHAEKLAGWMNK